jgi:hypothetical protein
VTISTEARLYQYSGNGTSKTFSFNLPVLDAAHVRVSVNGAVKTSGFTLTLNDPQPGGQVVFDEAPANNASVVIERIVPMTQETSLAAYGPFPSKTIENALDLHVMRMQQLRDDLSTVSASVTSEQALRAAADAAILAAGQIPQNIGTTAFTANGLISARTLAARFGQRINLVDMGAIADGTSHPLSERYSTLGAAQAVYPFVTSLSQQIDYAAIQAAVNKIPNGSWSTSDPPRHLEIPQGSYVTDTEIEFTSKMWLQVKGIGNATFLWMGSDPSKSIFNVNACYQMQFENLGFGCMAGYRAYAAIQFLGYLGQHSLTFLDVEGRTSLGGCAFDYGFVTDSPNANNDHFNFYYCKAQNCRRACVLIGPRVISSQSKSHKFYGCFFQSASDANAEGYGVQCYGSFYWFGGAIGSNPGADFQIAAVSGGEAIYICGANSEGSARLLGGDPWTMWQPNTTYAINSLISNDSGKMYIATSATGVSAGSGGPTGTGGSISDGTVTWSYLGTVANLTNAGSSNGNPVPIVIDSYRFATWAKPDRWINGHHYTSGTQVTEKRGRRIFQCTQTGDSSGSGDGPASVATGIVDNTCRWDYVGSTGIPLDGFEELSGGGTVMCAAPNSDELDSTQSNSKSVGISIPVYSTFPGLIIRNSFFYMDSAVTRRMKFYMPRGGGLENCTITGTDPRISPIIGMHGCGTNSGKRTVYTGPFTPDAYPKWIRNCALINSTAGGAFDYGVSYASIPIYAERERPHGSSYWDYSSWQGGNSSYTIYSPQEVMRFGLSQNITSLSIQRAPTQPGQSATFLFQQPSAGGTYNYTVGGWGSEFVLCGGAFNMPTGASAAASITFRFDEVTAKWVEVCRTHNAV